MATVVHTVRCHLTASAPGATRCRLGQLSPLSASQARADAKRAVYASLLRFPIARPRRGADDGARVL